MSRKRSNRNSNSGKYQVPGTPVTPMPPEPVAASGTIPRPSVSEAETSDSAAPTPRLTEAESGSGAVQVAKQRSGGPEGGLVGGSGKKGGGPKEIREVARNSFAARIPVLEGIVDGLSEEACSVCNRRDAAASARVAAAALLAKHSGLDLSKGLGLDELKALVTDLADSVDDLLDKLENGRLEFEDAREVLLEEWRVLTAPYSGG